MDLEKSGLTPETIEASGIYSVCPADINKTLGKNIPVKSLMAIPYPDTPFVRYKLFPPTKFPQDDKPRKYYQPPGSSIYLYQPPGFDPNGEVIRITEGEKKALEGTQEGLNVAGLGGIWNFAYKDDSDKPILIDALKNIPWAGKMVELVPDGDFQKNPSVCHAVFRLGSLLEKEGAKVSVVRLPGDEKLDSFLCGHSVEAFSSLELLTLEDRIFRPAQVQEYGLIHAIRGSVLGLKDFLSLEIKPQPYILKPILKPGSQAMIFSKRGLGKTMLATSIAVAVTHNVPIGRWIPECPVGVLYVDAEMSTEEFQKRMQSLTRGLPDPVAPLEILSSEWFERLGFPRPNLTDANWRNAIYSYLSEGKYKLLILDCHTALTPGLDESSQKETSAISWWLVSIRFLGVSTILLHHAGKSGDQRGSTGREDFLDVIIQLLPPKGYHQEDGCNVDVILTKTRSIWGADASPFNFKIVPVGDGLTWATKEKDASKKDIIIAMLGQKIPAADIASSLEVNRAYVYKVKNDAIQDGYLAKKGGFTTDGEIKFGGVEIEEFL
jgi:putative DNA primase/helicase